MTIANDEWKSHVSSCEKCRKFDPEHTATLAHVCLQGAPLIKRVLAASAPKKERAPRNTGKVHMRYVGDA